jgi:hypothetical protein
LRQLFNEEIVLRPGPDRSLWAEYEIRPGALIRVGTDGCVFSAREIRQLKSRDKPFKVTESAPRGEGRLIVRVHPSGLKEFYYRYRLKERDRLLRIGRFEQTPGDGGMKLEEARAQLAKLVGIQRPS